MEKTEKVVGEITDFVNSFSMKSEEFNKIMSREHRTLQQSFTRLCLKWSEHCATEEYQTDLRNQSSKEVSIKLIEAFKTLHGDEKCFSELKPSQFLPLI